MDTNKKNYSKNNPEELEVKNLSYNEERHSFELDVNDNDPVWEHPADYSTLSKGADQDTSDYDVSNPFVGHEYADKEDLEREELEHSGMRITDQKSLMTSRIDKELARDDEDFRDDLDEEGYPINNL